MYFVYGQFLKQILEKINCRDVTITGVTVNCSINNKVTLV